MRNTKDLVNRFRYIILAVLTVATLAYGYYLYRIYNPATPPEPPTVNVTVMADGSISLDGTHYVATEQLAPKVAQLQHDNPAVSFTIHAPDAVHFQPISKAVLLLQNSGARTVWVVNDNNKNRAK